MVNVPAKEAARTIVDLKKNCTPDIRRMGCPGGTRSVFTRAFRAKRELQCIFLGKKAIVITSKDGTTIFFSDYNLFLGKLKKKNGPKSVRKY